MAKKTARASKPGQQRSKEVQWRKRMAAQARTGAGGAIEETDDEQYSVAPDAQPSYTPRAAANGSSPSGVTRSTASPSSRAQMTSAAAQRRTAAMARTGARTRLATNTMSITDEMHYIKGDIRKLIILTVICVAIIIALSFIVPSIIK